MKNTVKRVRVVLTTADEDGKETECTVLDVEGCSLEPVSATFDHNIPCEPVYDNYTGMVGGFRYGHKPETFRLSVSKYHDPYKSR